MWQFFLMKMILFIIVSSSIVGTSHALLSSQRHQYTNAFSKIILPSINTVRTTTSTRLRDRILALQTTSFNDNNEFSSFLEGQTLLSIEECIDAYNRNKLNQEGVTFVDASWWHKGDLNGREIFERGPRIPGSVHIDMDDIAARGDLFPELNPKNLPHMLPPKELFTAAMNHFQIKESNHIIIYGRESCFFTPRTLFLFRFMGHSPSKVHLMQGSFEEWIEAGGEIETEPTSLITAKELISSEFKNENNISYKAVSNAENVCNMNDILAYMIKSDDEGHLSNENEENDIIVLDPRGSSFAKGHMPGAIHVPYSSLVNPENSLKFKSVEELQSIFESAGVDVKSKKKIICSCGSGVSVCNLFLALELCGRDNNNTYLYDGSWAEWGKDPNTPKSIQTKQK